MAWGVGLIQEAGQAVISFLPREGSSPSPEVSILILSVAAPGTVLRLQCGCEPATPDSCSAQAELSPLPCSKGQGRAANRQSDSWIWGVRCTLDEKLGDGGESCGSAPGQCSLQPEDTSLRALIFSFFSPLWLGSTRRPFWTAVQASS